MPLQFNIGDPMTTKKRTRRLSRREFIAIGVLAASGIAVKVAFDWHESEEDQARADFEGTLKQGFSMGETLTLDADAEEAALDKNGFPYSAGFPFTGTMELKVLSATLFDAPEDAGIATENLAPWWQGRNDESFLLIEVELNNISATVPWNSGTQERFNISFLGLPSQGEIPYFSGMPENADPIEEASNFDLPQGETCTYRLGFFVFPDAIPERLDVGAVQGKYWVELDIDDQRKKEPEQ